MRVTSAEPLLAVVQRGAHADLLSMLIKELDADVSLADVKGWSL
jgi:hypothetical protein